MCERQVRVAGGALDEGRTQAEDWQECRAIVPLGVSTLTVPSTSTTGSYSISWTAVANASSYRLEQSINSGTWELGALKTQVQQWN